MVATHSAEAVLKNEIKWLEVSAVDDRLEGEWISNSRKKLFALNHLHCVALSGSNTLHRLVCFGMWSCAELKPLFIVIFDHECELTLCDFEF